MHQTTDILYYEVLDIPLPQLEELKILKFSFHNQKTEHVCDQIIRLPRVQTVEYLLNELKEKLKEYNIQGDLRLMEVCLDAVAQSLSFKVFEQQLYFMPVFNMGATLDNAHIRET